MKCYDLDNCSIVIVKDWQDLLDVLNDLLQCCQNIDANTDEIEAKLDQQISLLTSIDGKVATEATLLTIKADTASIIAELQALNATDFATETTLAAIKAQTDKLTFTGGDLNVNATVSFPAGAQRPIELVEATVNGSTLSGVQSMSILFDGKNGTLDGISVDDQYIASYAPNGVNDTIGSIPFTVPTTKGQRVLITYVKVI